MLFAFSSFVMPALARVAPAQGIAVMQAINVAAINRWFMGAFMGTALGCAVLAVASVLYRDEPAARLRLAGALLYLVGTLGVTAAFDVPRNDALERVRPDSVEGAVLWAGYLREWTTWNHARAAAALGAALLLTLALVRSRTGLRARTARAARGVHSPRE